MRSLSHEKLENVDIKSLKERSTELQEIIHNNMSGSFGDPDYLAELLKIERVLAIRGK